MITAFYGTDSISAKHAAAKEAVPYTLETLDDAIELAASQSLFGPAPRVCIYPADKITAKDVKLLKENAPRIGDLTLAFTTKAPNATVKKSSFISKSEESFPRSPAAAKTWVREKAESIYGISDLTADIVAGLAQLVVRNPEQTHSALRLIKHLDTKLRADWREYITLPPEQPPIWKAVDSYTAGNPSEFVTFLTDDNAYQLMSMVASRTALLVIASQSPTFDAANYGVNANTWSSACRLANTKPVQVWEQVHRVTMQTALDLRTTGITPVAAMSALLLASVEVARILGSEQ